MTQLNRGTVDLVRIMFDPSWPRIVLANFSVGASTDSAPRIQQEDGSSSCTLIDGKDVLRHMLFKRGKSSFARAAYVDRWFERSGSGRELALCPLGMRSVVKMEVHPDD